MAFRIVLCFLFLPLSVLLHLALGRTLFTIFPFGDREEVSDSHFYLFGVLLHLTATLLLVCLNIPLGVATALPFLLLFYRPVNIRSRLAFPRFEMTFNFMLWTSVHLGLGLSLFQATDGIVTPWRNNYGDLAFHLGMISSFVFGSSGVPEFHLFPGTILSYPFFMNLWSAIYFQIAPSWYMLSVIFLFQWCVVWTLIYRFLDGDKNPLLPWAILFGGGSYFVVGTEANSVSNEKSPFSVFITTIWVTQRSAMFGAAVVLGVLRLVFDWIDERKESLLFVAACLFLLSPLVHAHLLLTLAIYLLSLYGALLLSRKVRLSEIKDFNSKYIKMLIPFAAISIFLSIWLLQKKSIVKFITGWYGRGDSAILQLVSSASMWGQTLFSQFVGLYLLWICTKRHAYFLPLISCFLLANFIQVSVWEWDQLKIFLGLYIIFIFLWTQLKDPDLRYLQVILLLFMVPAVYDLAKLFKQGENFTVYSKQDIERAEAMRARTPRGSVLAASGKHNSPVTLSGRSLYSGYDGTLFSHGIDYKARKAVNDSFEKLMKCSKIEEICPDYLYFSDDEKRLWKRSSAKHPHLKVTGLDYLYKFYEK